MSKELKTRCNKVSSQFYQHLFINERSTKNLAKIPEWHIYFCTLIKITKTIIFLNNINYRNLSSNNCILAKCHCTDETIVK